jgi:WXG100 family type VII secretion target
VTGDINVSYEQIESSMGSLRKGQQEFERELRQMMSKIDGLVGGGFKTSRASGKFKESYDQWNKGAKNAVEGLDEMISFLQKAASQHKDLDEALAQSTGG